MSTDGVLAELDRLEGTYRRAVVLTQELLDRLNAEDSALDSDEIAACLKSREEAISLAEGLIPLYTGAPLLDALGRLKRADRVRANRLVTSAKSQAREALRLGARLAGMIEENRNKLREELGGVADGAKLLKGYKGFKANIPYRFNRRA